MDLLTFCFYFVFKWKSDQVLEAVRSYLMALLEASEMLGNVGSQDLMHKILHVSNEAHRLQPADAARRLSALFV